MYPATGREGKLLSFLRAHWLSVGFLVITLLAVLIRASGFSYVSHDYSAFLEPWTLYLKRHGHFGGLASLQSDYSSPYLVLLAFLSYLPSPFYGIKLLSCAGDLACALLASWVVWEVSQQKGAALFAYGAVLLCPTLWLNSAFWGQCDVFYTVFLLGMLVCFLKDEPALGWFCFGMAFSLKLQAVFLLPFLAVCYLCGRYRLRDTLAALLAFGVANLPGWLAGMPFFRAFGIYFLQSKNYRGGLSWNAASLYGLLPNGGNGLLGKAGVLFALAVMAAFACAVLAKPPALSQKKLLLLFLASAVVTPYLLPYMHERYFYVAEVAVLICSAVAPRRWWLSLLVILPGCGTYLRYLFGAGRLSLPVLSLVFSAAAVATAALLIRDLWSGSEPGAEPALGCEK